MGACDFQQHEAGLIGADEFILDNQYRAETGTEGNRLRCLMVAPIPVSWARKKGGLHTVVDSTTLSRRALKNHMATKIANKMR